MNSECATANNLFDGLTCAGRYRIGRSMGEGSMAQLFRAERIRDGREVVLKCVSGVQSSSRRQLRAEARALAALSHPHIVNFVEHGEGADVCFVAMEALDGHDLSERIAQRKVNRIDALLWLGQLASALDHVHARGLVHRDIKPGNVVIHRGADGIERAVLVDFGLATEQVAEAPKEKAKFLCGTPAYMAPEQALGMESAIGPATDRYALAAIAFELLTGERAYPRASVGELLLMLLETSPRRPSDLGAFEPAVDAVFQKAMAREPSQRFNSAVEMVLALGSALRGPRQRRARTDDPTKRPTIPAKAA